MYFNESFLPFKKKQRLSFTIKFLLELENTHKIFLLLPYESTLLFTQKIVLGDSLCIDRVNDLLVKILVKLINLLKSGIVPKELKISKISPI